MHADIGKLREPAHSRAIAAAGSGDPLRPLEAELASHYENAWRRLEAEVVWFRKANGIGGDPDERVTLATSASYAAVLAFREEIEYATRGQSARKARLAAIRVTGANAVALRQRVDAAEIMEITVREHQRRAMDFFLQTVGQPTAQQVVARSEDAARRQGEAMRARQQRIEDARPLAAAVFLALMAGWFYTQSKMSPEEAKKAFDALAQQVSFGCANYFRPSPFSVGTCW